MRPHSRVSTGIGMVVLALGLSVAGCYHAVIETGRPQSGTRIEKKWAHGFLFGLVPPDAIETASQCPNGVARVETQHSFLNQVAYAVTGGLYSPMTIEAFCAAPGEQDDAAVLTYRPGQARDVRLEAALQSREPFYIRIERAR